MRCASHIVDNRPETGNFDTVRATRAMGAMGAMDVGDLVGHLGAMDLLAAMAIREQRALWALKA